MLRPLTPEALAQQTKCLAPSDKWPRRRHQRLKQNAFRAAPFTASGGERMAGTELEKESRCVYSRFWSSLIMDLSINKARAGEQTPGSMGRWTSVGTATTSGNTTTFYGADGRRTGSATTAATLKRSTVPMAGGWLRNRDRQTLKQKPPDDPDNQNQVHRTANCARDARAPELQSRLLGRIII